jgi:hypothetical protein
MTSAPVVEILVDLLRVGIRVEAHGGKIRGTPPQALTADLRARIRANSVELVRLFSRTDTVPPSSRTKSPDAPPLASAVPVEREGGTYSCAPTFCRACRGREFILVETDDGWTCPRCHPPLPGAVIVARWIEAPAPKPAKTADLFDTREVDDVG